MGFREFTSIEEINEWAAKQYGEFLSHPEEPIYDVVFSYTGSAYYAMNNWLRGLPLMSLEELKETKKYSSFRDETVALYEYIMGYRLNEDINVYRSVTRRGIKELFRSWLPRKGMTGIEKAFMSTTMLRSTAVRYSKKNKGVTMRIRVPKGVHALYVSQDDYKGNLLKEYELLLRPGIELRVIKSGLFAIECEVVPSLEEQATLESE